MQLKDDYFDALFVSPLERARQTAEIITKGRELQPALLPSLREIDLYSFQGLLKQQGKQQYGEQFSRWQLQAHQFEIDGHAPVRELWYRASIAWQQILGAQQNAQCTLVVAHNAVNQAMIATAMGLDPLYFRRLLQSNAATSVLDFVPTMFGPPRVTLDRLNQV